MGRAATLTLGLLVALPGAAEVSPSHWAASFVGPVALRLPPRYRIRNLSVDSLMWEYSGPGYEFVIDLGRYPDDEGSPAGRADWKVRYETIGGRPAKLVTYRAGDRHHVTGTWRNVRPGIHLSISGWSVGEGDTMLRIVRTVRLGRRRIGSIHLPLR